MNNPSKFLIFANQADIQAETTTNPALRSHFIHMAAQWRRFADLTDVTAPDHAAIRS